MDVKYFGLMLLRGIGQAGLPVKEIKQLMKDNSLLSVETADRTQFVIKIVRSDPESYFSVHGQADREKNDKNNHLYSDIYKRLNLQAIGCFVKEEKLQYWLGHSDAQTTLNIYSHFNRRRLNLSENDLSEISLASARLF